MGSPRLGEKSLSQAFYRHRPQPISPPRLTDVPEKAACTLVPHTASSHLYSEYTALHLQSGAQRPAIYISLEREPGPPSIPASSPSWQLLITSSAGCSLLPLAEATRNKCTCVHTKHPREARLPYPGRECDHPRPASGVRTLYL